MPPDYPEIEARTVTPEQLIARFRDKPLEASKKWNYSKSGYCCLVYPIEKVSGQKGA